MSMWNLEQLRHMLCEELNEITEKQELSAGDLETVHKLTDTIKNIDKICLMDESCEYSQSGDWEMEGRGTYGRGNSYAGRQGTHYVRGHYSRESGRENRSRNGEYSRDHARDDFVSQLENMLEEAGTSRDREAIQRCLEQIRKS